MPANKRNVRGRGSAPTEKLPELSITARGRGRAECGGVLVISLFCYDRETMGEKSSRNPLIVRYIDDENKIFGILNSLALF